MYYCDRLVIFCEIDRRWDVLGVLEFCVDFEFLGIYLGRIRFGLDEERIKEEFIIGCFEIFWISECWRILFVYKIFIVCFINNVIFF